MSVSPGTAPYAVDATKFKTRFWSDVTPYEVGVPATARWFAEQHRRSPGQSHFGLELPT